MRVGILRYVQTRILEKRTGTNRLKLASRAPARLTYVKSSTSACLACGSSFPASAKNEGGYSSSYEPRAGSLGAERARVGARGAVVVTRGRARRLLRAETRTPASRRGPAPPTSASPRPADPPACTFQVSDFWTVDGSNATTSTGLLVGSPHSSPSYPREPKYTQSPPHVGFLIAPVVGPGVCRRREECALRLGACTTRSRERLSALESLSFASEKSLTCPSAHTRLRYSKVLQDTPRYSKIPRDAANARERLSSPRLSSQRKYLILETG